MVAAHTDWRWWGRLKTKLPGLLCALLLKHAAAGLISCLRALLLQLLCSCHPEMFLLCSFFFSELCTH